ncbi:MULTISPECIES: SusC/RagA family TonB-linked outer membrane protein [Sanguibacteroides]|uniref:Secretin/TonB short N-terminal domain-containing protein n=1 Tax=Sanguibacteroides justesenii TaxID=1547597 RepID=A0A0C3RAX7_9PORP|nr:MULTISPECIES: SusC/RagA family TonB-linked outer membrane protein [Sanguibacteroides]KIO42756.1 hypothetical protein BA92_12835 [Sanguibacteroides justesenii]PXZ44073.1 SusC/RagA family TonB-linked outer membrane protein [Sanguibacteroides justesenii]
MKKILMSLRDPSGRLKKAWVMSKWTLLFVLLGMFNVHGAVYSQNEQQVTLSMKNAYLKDVIWAIERQTAFTFMYNQEDLDKVGKIDVKLKASKIEEILKACLKGTGLTYVIQDAVIVLKPIAPDDKVKEIRIVGKVIDEKKLPLPGVTVLIKGTKLGTATDFNGKYSLKLPEMKNIVLIFSFMGMETQEIKYTGKDTINVTLKEDKVKLQDVVVTGYMNIRKESFTGNATTVTKEQLLKTNNKNVIAALQIFDPSFRIKENNIWGSDPNALPEFNLRGESSIGMNKGLDIEQERRTQRTNLKDNPNLPIFILDGFEVPVDKIYDMDVNRIESMTILKDAAATALYGSRAANGVIVVTSVPPKPGEMQVRYNFTGGVELPDLSDYNLCSAEEKLEAERLAGVYTASIPSGQADKDILYVKKLQNILRGVDTDWMSKPLRNAFNHTHSINISGGVESIRYSLDLNYDSNKGVMKGSHRTRAGAGLNLDYRNKEWLQLMNSITYSTTRSEDSPYGSFSRYAELLPYDAVYDENGELVKDLEFSNASGSYGKSNPLWDVANLANYYNRGKTEDITDNLSLNLYFKHGFQAKGQFSISKSTSKSESFTDPKDKSDGNEKGSLSRSLTDDYRWNLNLMLYYNSSIGKHFINATLGMNASESKSESTSMTFKGFQMGGLHSPAFAEKQPDKTNINTSESRLVGFLGSVNYSYNDVYLFDGSFRFDGSSQFGKDKRFAPFWSVGVGINFHNYAFLKDNWLVSMLKIRASYGSTGKVNFPPYSAITTYKTDTDAWYFTGPASGLMALGNPKLKWETTNTLDAGFSVSFLQDLIYLDFAYYHKKTIDLIDAISVRTSSGFKDYKTNMGSVLNEGIEIRMNATLFKNRDWMITLNGNLGHNKNKILEIGAEMNAYNQQLLDEYNKYKDPTQPDNPGMLGPPMDKSEYAGLLSTPLIQYYKGASTTALYAVRSDGIDPANGRERLIKKNGMPTYTWDANDQVVVGDKNPDIQGAFGFNVAYKNFYLNADFTYQYGAQSYNATLLNRVENAQIETQNVDKRVLTQRWKNAGDRVPYYDLNINGKNNAAKVDRPTTRFVQDNNYVNFSGLSVGYDFNKEMISKWRLATLGIRFNANDICRWASIKEERGTSYPFARTYNFTINLGF